MTGLVIAGLVVLIVLSTAVGVLLEDVDRRDRLAELRAERRRRMDPHRGRRDWPHTQFRKERPHVHP